MKITWALGIVSVSAALLLAGCSGGSERPARPTSSSGGGGGGSTASAAKEEGGTKTEEAKVGRTGDGWGTLKGRFVVSGDVAAPEMITPTKDAEYCGKHPLFDEAVLVGENGGLKNVVIYIRSDEGDGLEISPELEASASADSELDNKECRFDNHITLVWVGKQKLLVKNSDPVGHNTNVQPLRGEGFNQLLQPNDEFSWEFDGNQNLPIPVACNIHAWMKGYVLPRENPYMTVSAEDGTFTIEGLPTGTWEFQVWHEAAGYLETGDWKKGRFTHTIEEGDNDLGEIQITAADLK